MHGQPAPPRPAFEQRYATLPPSLAHRPGEGPSIVSTHLSLGDGSFRSGGEFGELEWVASVREEIELDNEDDSVVFMDRSDVAATALSRPPLPINASSVQDASALSAYSFSGSAGHRSGAASSRAAAPPAKPAPPSAPIAMSCWPKAWLKALWSAGSAAYIWATRSIKSPSTRRNSGSQPPWSMGPITFSRSWSSDRQARPQRGGGLPLG